MARLTTAAPAKINVGLHVLRRRADGYHDLDTVFVRIPWCDRVSVDPAPKITMTCTDPALPTDGQNLCMKAAQLLSERFGVSRGARIHLEKVVPYGAGLGSGSSDAAATIRLLCRSWDLHPSPDELLRIALEIGSDVPFFFGPPIARGTGRGEILQPFEAPVLSDLALVVVVPDVHISTTEAYSMVTAHDTDRPDLVSLVQGSDPSRWRGRIVNDFEQPVRRRYPALEGIFAALEDAGATFVSLSGSGSAVFGLFTDAEAAGRAVAAFRGARVNVWSGLAGDPPAGP